MASVAAVAAELSCYKSQLTDLLHQNYCIMLSTCSETTEYPPSVKSKTARGKYKQQVLCDRPETLFLDQYKDGRACNSIFYTDKPYACLNVIRSQYTSVKRAGMCSALKISVLQENDPDSTIMTVNLFKNGTGGEAAVQLRQQH